jgi:hypothetical protein
LNWEQTLHQFHMDSFPDIQQFSQHQVIEHRLAHSHKPGAKECTIYFGTLSSAMDFTKETLINKLQWLHNANLEYLNHFKQAFHSMQHNQRLINLCKSSSTILVADHNEIYVDQGTSKEQGRFANCYDQSKWFDAIQHILVWAVMTYAIYDYVHSATHNEDEAANVHEKQLIVVVNMTS